MILNFALHCLLFFLALLGLVWFARRDAVRSYRRRVVEPLMERNHTLVGIGCSLVDQCRDAHKENDRLTNNLSAALRANARQESAHKARVEFLRERISYLAQQADLLANNNAEFQAKLKRSIIKGQRTTIR